ncbi:YgfZ/GcvT domain-containing protein [Gloeocapsopsis dulcis]|uniref:Folate-binding protein YgfZ n=1 Tax=Gloeocapsopsis dulcis AAB1 = 1H9 TaxID=1433147 RepID=A0A6N8G3M9_9CHRO|nr:folate-binding protein YgfZ [Gloeocapsopsis dulcis]MUL38676.1 folate-binding protein YgfZ [Gloeocapsopsis dulcis AAB1 = 1H9]WNN88322.1 folate-binding protein YgfZ [Gloeocapsopsis dulcis]
MQQLRNIQVKTGAKFAGNTQDIEVPVSFGNDVAGLQASQEEIVVCDRSHWGRIQVSDEERLRFLHNQSTNDFQQLKPGQGCDTVFITSTARTIDLVTAYVTEEAVLLLVSPNRRKFLMEWLDRYIFFADKVQLKDITDETAAFSLIGPKSDAVLEQLGASAIINQPYAHHTLVNIGSEVRVTVGSGLALPGYTLIVPVAAAANVWNSIVQAGVKPIGDRVWEQLRILQGRPTPEKELTEDYNPLEAGLWHSISFDKGCYIGQETIARLNTYKGVKQHLWGIRLDSQVEPGGVITVGDEKVGRLTSCTATEQGYFGLGYIRNKAGGIGLRVEIGDTRGEIVDVPFLTHEYYQGE